ncbi:MAG: hypothetical protein WBB91_03745 [Nostocoides sp.]|uniref:hypothetical protein n=1 Tax=Nostocoides sp. TaxID=1917966 RepID=UPI003C708DFD
MSSPSIRSFETHRFHKGWLIVTAVVIGSFGPVFSLATRASTSGPARWTLELLNGPGGDAESFAGTTQFLTALTGGFLFGWGVMVLGLRAWVYDAAPDGVRRSVVAGLLSWFVLDSAGSIASGNPWNAFFNVIVLLVAVGPMWRPARG